MVFHETVRQQNKHSMNKAKLWFSIFFFKVQDYCKIINEAYFDYISIYAFSIYFSQKNNLMKNTFEWFLLNHIFDHMVHVYSD